MMLHQRKPIDDLMVGRREANVLMRRPLEFVENSRLMVYKSLKGGESTVIALHELRRLTSERGIQEPILVSVAPEAPSFADFGYPLLKARPRSGWRLLGNKVAVTLG
jgi:hypothetical protein